MATPQYQLIMRSGPNPGKTFLLEKEENLLGRDLANDIVVSELEVSRRHVRFMIKDDRVLVEDLGSTNGTFLNGERISTAQELQSGDAITLGEEIVLVFQEEELEDEEPYVVMQEPETVQPAAPAPETYQPQPDLADYPQPQPVAVVEEPEAEPEHIPDIRERIQKEDRGKRGMPTWLIILIVAIVVLVLVIAVTLWFMPESWWCAIDIFNLIPACPTL